MAKAVVLARSRISNQTRFDDELKGFLFGFGGDSNPQKDTVDLLNDMTVDFISKVTAEAANVARALNMPFDNEAVMFTVRNDLRKRERAQELLQSYTDIKRLRAGLSREITSTLRKAERPGGAASSGGTAASSSAADGAPPAKSRKRPATGEKTDRSKKEPAAGDSAPKKKKKPATPKAAGATTSASSSVQQATTSHGNTVSATTGAPIKTVNTSAAADVPRASSAATSSASAAQNSDAQTEFML